MTDEELKFLVAGLAVAQQETTLKMQETTLRMSELFQKSEQERIASSRKMD